MLRNGGNAIPDQETLGRSPRRADVWGSVSCASKCEGCDGRTPGYALGKSTGWLPSLPSWHSTDSPDHWRWKGTGARAPERLRQPTLERMPHPPRTPLVPSGDNEGAYASEIDGVPPGYVIIHSPLPSAQFFTFVAYAKDHKCDKDFNPYLLTDEGTSTG